MAQREHLASRLGFLLLSAGCAIGLGNVWRFPFITGKYGGAVFLAVYLLFLLIPPPGRLISRIIGIPGESTLCLYARKKLLMEINFP